jgi:FkbH-like protein
VAKQTLDIISALQGNAAKCVILDLDNTLWGGIIGDDGSENIHIGNLGIGKAFTEFQLWLRSLKERGIILAVCSKNTETVAKEVFISHPDMVLRLEDIAVFVANWENKVDNIRHIQATLNIGFDSMVFFDDNPFERNMVRENIPELIIPELPEDPADYLEFLYAENLFETASYSNEDLQRTEHYQLEAKRTVAQQAFTDERSFLASIRMSSDVQPFNKFNTPRVAQLSQRSNQFNLRTVRYTEADIERMSADDNFKTFTFTLEDKFGDNGLICAVILRKEDAETLFIDTWFMSCRVLKRGMEQFVLNTIMAYAASQSYRTIKGEFVPTDKNGMVQDHYKNLGFEQKDNYWYLDVNGYEPKECFIEVKQVTSNG